MILKYKKNEDKKISEYFNINEFQCKCKNKSCEYTLIDPTLVRALDTLRRKINQPLYINSGYRCAKHNKSDNVKGKKNSQHLLGRAADLRLPEGMSLKQFNKFVLDIEGFTFIKVYPTKNFIHVDTRIL